MTWKHSQRLGRSLLAMTMALVATAGICMPRVASAADAPRKKVLIIGIDGLRPDALEKADAPNLHALIAKGAYSPDAQSESRTFSAPNWSTIMTGLHNDRHEVHSNNYKDSKIAQWPDFFTFLEGHNANLNTFRLMTWDSFNNNQPTGADVNLFEDYRRGGDEKMTQRAVSLLSGTDEEIKQDPDVLFIYFADVDVSGHNHGFYPETPQYLEKINTADQQVGRMLKAIESRPDRSKEHWLIIVVSDHGGSMDHRHHGNTADRRTIPFIVAGEDAAPGRIFPNARNVDVARTVLTYMGVPIDPAWQLDGHAVGLTPTAPPKAALNKNLIFNGDAEYDRGFPQDKVNIYDQYSSGWLDEGHFEVNVLTYDVDTAAHPGYISPVQAREVGGGANFFSGSAAAVGRMTQTIDLTPLKDEIDGQKLEFHLSAWLGGWKNDPDCAMFIVRFYDMSDHVIQTALVGPVTPAQRQRKSGLVHCQVKRNLTPGARRATVELLMVRLAGNTNDAYADNLSLILQPRPPKKKKAN